MVTKDKKHMLQLLSESHTANLSLLEGTDLETPVHTNSDWQIRDIIWHLTTWDREVARSIHAFRVGNEYSISSFNEDKYNDSAFQEGRKLIEDQVIEEYKEAREAFVNSVNELPVEKVSEEMLFPWGDESGDIFQLVEYMVEHDAEHRTEITAAIGS